jgi:beta-xylosidase/LmbE family N-acetylglucosaminyl deacetylase
MIEAVMFWNEPNNKSHWDFEVDPGWALFARMIKQAAAAVKKENPNLTRVLGGMSPIDQQFVLNLQGRGALDDFNAIAVHGFPLDWNHWKLDDWPEKIREIQQVTDLPVWVSEVGISTFGAEEVQVFGLRRTAELLCGLVPRIHWYSLYDLPQAWPATTRHREAEGSSYYRHFYMGLLREDGSPKPALDILPEFTPEMGICQWFHFEDHRLEQAVEWLHKLGVKKLRTGLSWADSFRPGAEEWFDRQMKALAEFDVTATFCFTPEHRGIQPHHTSAPLCLEEFAEFCAEMVRRYAPPPRTELQKLIGTPPTERESIEFPWNGGHSYSDPAGINALRFMVRPDLAEQPLKVAFVCAHFDDETIGAGSRLGLLGSAASLIYITEGSPLNLADATAAGFESREKYGAARRAELHAALTSVGALPADIRFLNYPDQEATLNMAAITADLVVAFEELRPDVVVSHPYEGGHPDHDATAFAVQAACEQLQLEQGWSPVRLEMASYHNRNGEICPGEFLPADKCPVSIVYLSDAEIEQKRRMLACDATRQNTLQYFPPELELFRPAPVYDFSRAPHPGKLFYEICEGGMTGQRWRELAMARRERATGETVRT